MRVSICAVIVSLGLCGCMSTTTLVLQEQSASAEPVRAAYDATLIDKDIAFWKAKVAHDPTGAIGWSQLAGAYLKRSKESDSMEAAKLAEAASRKSLSLRTEGNVGAANKLVSSLLEQHRFGDALKVANYALTLNAENGTAIQQKISVLIELGRYKEARELARTKAIKLDDPSGWAIEARLAQLDGSASQAEGLLRRGLQTMKMAAGTSRETVAWFHVKLGAHHLLVDAVDQAERDFEGALAVYPRSYKAMIGLQKVAIAQKDWQSAVDWGHKAEAIVTMPESLAMMSEAYEQLGDTAMASEHLGEALAAAGMHDHSGGSARHHHDGTKPHGHPLDRQLTSILADRGLYLDEAVAAARRDLAERGDWEAYENLAWALYRHGRGDEAKGLLAKAPEMPTLSPTSALRLALINGDAVGEQAALKAHSISPILRSWSAASQRG